MRITHIFSVPYLVLVIFLFAAMGCDSSPEIAPVSGVVTFNGKPITDGIIQLYPVKSGPLAAGRLNESGAFELTTKAPGDGAYVGDYVVVVVPTSDINELEKELQPGRPRRKKFENIPMQVRDQATSTLRTTVQSGPNQFEFDLANIDGNS